MAKAKNNHIAVQVAGPIMLFADRQIVKIILRNLLDNANKYTSGGTISLISNKESNQIFITIRDTGKGMTAKQIEILNNMSASTSTNATGGMGYKIVKDLSAIAGCIITAKGVADAGS